MAKTPTFCRTFKTACKNGKSPWLTVQNIAKKNKCTEAKIWETLCKHNFAICKKFNGQSIWIPTEFPKTTRENSKIGETYFWWFALEFCLEQGWVTPEQIYTWNMKQVCWYCCNCVSKFYKKPKGFNPNAKVKGFKWNATAPLQMTKQACKSSCVKRKAA